MLVKTLGVFILGLLGGILVHSLFFTLAIPPYIIGIFLVIGSLCCVWKNKWLFFVGVFVIAFGFGLLRYTVGINTEREHLFDLFVEHEELVMLKGKIVSDPLVDAWSSEFILESESLLVHGESLEAETRVRVKTDIFGDYHYGDRVHVKGKLQKPTAFEADTGRTFDYASYLAKDDIYYTMSYAETSFLGREKSFIRSLYHLKHQFLGNIYKILPMPESGLLAGVLFGQKKSLGDKYEEKFRIVGLMHIVVLSGYNVALVIQLMLKILSFLPRNIRSLLAVLGIAAFALLVGAGPTVLRASIMAVFLVLANVLGAQYNITRALIIAGVVMVLWNPKILYFDISFQLSFLATYGLILFSPWLEEKLHFLPKAFAVRDSAVATLAAQIMVMPIIFYYIGEFSIISPVVNVLVLFAVPLSMMTGFLAASLFFVSSLLSSFFTVISHALLWYQLAIVDIFASFSFASLQIPSFHWSLMVAAYALIFWWGQKISRKYREI